MEETTIDGLIAIETYLPVFPGFYGTIFETGEEGDTVFVDSMLQDQFDSCGNLDTYALASELLIQGREDVLNKDYLAFEAGVAKACCSVIEEALKEEGMPIRSIVYERVTYPREYNFANNAIDIAVLVESGEELRRYLLYACNEEARTEFDAFIVRRYTSYDGFIPYYSNDPDEWRNLLQTGDLNGHILGTAMEFVCHLAELDSFRLYQELDLPDESEFCDLNDAVFGGDPVRTKKAREIMQRVREGDEQWPKYAAMQPNEEVVKRQHAGWKENRAELIREAAAVLLGKEKDDRPEA